MAQGNYNVQVDSKRNDELGDLAQDFVAKSAQCIAFLSAAMACGPLDSDRRASAGFSQVHDSNFVTGC